MLLVSFTQILSEFREMGYSFAHDSQPIVGQPCEWFDSFVSLQPAFTSSSGGGG